MDVQNWIISMANNGRLMRRVNEGQLMNGINDDGVNDENTVVNDGSYFMVIGWQS